MTKETWDNYEFGGNKQLALERDNFECQDCGMSQEKHIILFNTELIVHHKDGQGRRSKKKNHNIDNLITLCVRCHAKIHREIEMKERYGELMDQDDSEWAFPKLRQLVLNEISKGKKVGDAKRIVAKDIGFSYTTVDHRYYEKKDDMRSIIQKRLKELDAKGDKNE